jgi:exodeoxyribonuclease VII small subunit
MSSGDDIGGSPKLDGATWSYEETVKHIETTIARIESGELELAAVFDEFAEAVTNLRQCELFLAERQQQMDLLIETLSDSQEF